MGGSCSTSCASCERIRSLRFGDGRTLRRPSPPGFFWHDAHVRLRSVFLTGFVALSLTPSAFAAGRVTVLSTSDVDYLDPGRTYYTFGYQVQEAVHRTLYALRPVDPAATPESATAGVPEIVPDLAAGPPEIGDGGRTVTVHLRAGVRYAPPVDREVVARDVAYAVSRTFSDSVAGGYTAYFDDLVGAPRAPPARPRAIRGIETPDDRTVVFRLRRPTGGAFAAALILPPTA